MNPAQVRRLRKLEAAVLSAKEKLTDYRSQLAAGCDHPAELVTDYDWEHDSGYGRQTMRRGKVCGVCLKISLWNDGSFYDRKDLTI